MEIRVVEEKGRSQIEVTILSGPDNPRVAGIVRQLQMVDGKLSGYIPGTINRRMVFFADRIRANFSAGISKFGSRYRE